MDISLFKQLHREGLISGPSLNKIKSLNRNTGFSLHWELRIILYLGVILLSGGLGILIYKNIDTIGHQAILGTIAAICLSCFCYCGRFSPGFTYLRSASVNSIFDYILLLGCLSLLSFIGYLQFQYSVFGDRYGLATFIPMLCLFFFAYFFDHLGVLSMGIVNLATWAGIAATPTHILTDNDFSNERLIFTGLALGFFLLCLGYVTKQKKLKAHFEFTYTNFGTHLIFISCLAGMFHFDSGYLVWLALLTCIAIFYYRKALRESAFYFILLLTLYGFVGLSYVIMKLIFDVANMDITGAYLSCVYFITAAAGMIIFLIKTNRKFKKL